MSLLHLMILLVSSFCDTSWLYLPYFPSFLRKVEKQADDYKKEVDAKIAENNKLKQNISVMEKRISEIENQQKMTKPPEKTDDALNMLKDDTLNSQKK